MQISQGGDLDPARRLMFSPVWDEQAIVFDARSGDFWVVGREVRNVLRSANDDPARASNQLQQLAPEIIENLIDHGIIKASSTS